jgi:hypothetical protein
MEYKNKETGEIESISQIKNSYDELLGNSGEFKEYVIKSLDKVNDYIKSSFPYQPIDGENTCNIVISKSYV